MEVVRLPERKITVRPLARVVTKKHTRQKLSSLRTVYSLRCVIRALTEKRAITLRPLRRRSWRSVLRAFSLKMVNHAFLREPLTRTLRYYLHRRCHGVRSLMM